MTEDNFSIASEVQMTVSGASADGARGRHGPWLVLLIALVVLLGRQRGQSEASKKAGCTKPSERHGE